MEDAEKTLIDYRAPTTKSRPTGQRGTASLVLAIIDFLIVVFLSGLGLCLGSIYRDLFLFPCFFVEVILWISAMLSLIVSTHRPRTRSDRVGVATLAVAFVGVAIIGATFLSIIVK